MSRSRGAASSRPDRRAGPVPDGIVAVLERKGRFLAAEPLFAPRERTVEGRGARGSARGAVADGRGGRLRAAAGDIVLLRPERGGRRLAVARVLGRPEIARDVIEALMIDRGLRRGFDAAVEQEAREAAARVARAAGERRDLRDLATFTVDPTGARDYDDAISARRIDRERTTVWVHIADVAAHVGERSLVDREARRRATSVYVPGAVEPMLPHALSSDACSLLPGLERAAVTVQLELRGTSVERASFYRSLIRSDERLDYDRVDRIFAGEEPLREPLREPLAAARAAAAALQSRRERSGALAIDSAEPEFAFDEGGEVTGVAARLQTESHRLIEHLMIAANEAVASHLERRGVPCLFRVHERPDPQRVELLVEQLASLEVPTPPLPDRLSPSAASELMGEISQRVQEHVRRTGRGRVALPALVLRSLKQAYYSPRNVGHAGLHSTSYCHFTSPIRRYPDLVCHRALLSTIGADEPGPRADELGELGAWTSERERDAMTIERDADDVARCFALERRLYELGPDAVFAGEVAGLISAGAFVAFGEDAGIVSDAPGPPPYEGMLPVRMLAAASGRGPRDWWELGEEGTLMRAQPSGATIRLGDPIGVRVARVSAPRGRVDLLPAG